jgi:hypothetical protein
MMRTIFTAGLAIGLFAIGATLAGPTRPAPALAPAPAPGEDERLTLSLSNELTDIYLKRDLDRLHKLLAPEYLGTAPGTNWDAERLAAEFPQIEMQAARRLRYTVKPLARDLLLLNEDVELYETYRGQNISGTYRMTTIWTERQGRWLLLFEQEIQLPPPTPADQPPPAPPVQPPPAVPPAGGT